MDSDTDVATSQPVSIDPARLRAQLPEAIETDELELRFQPIVDRDRQMVSAEALVRWNHPDHGVLSPAVTIPAAREAGLLRQLDLWVLDTAIRTVAHWPEVHGQAVSVAVNLDGLLPDEPDFVSTVHHLLANHDVAATRLVLEVTENALVDLSFPAQHAIRTLTEDGVGFAIDDFGTGYSSLSRLKDLAARTIKLDRQFVAGLTTASADFAITRAAVDMAHAMRRKIVAEGVETAAQFYLLTGLGADAFQGWLFSPPVPEAAFRELLHDDQLFTATSI